MVVHLEPEKTISQSSSLSFYIRQTKELHSIISASYPCLSSSITSTEVLKYCSAIVGHNKILSIVNAESGIHQLFHGVCGSDGAGKSDAVSLELQNVNLIINHLLSA